MLGRRIANRLGFDLIRYPSGTQMGASTRNLLERTACDLVVDVGANVGDYARSIRRLGYDGRIVSFEPDPRTAEKLRRAAATDPLWEVRAEALGSDKGRRSLLVATESQLSSFLPASPAGHQTFRELQGTVAEEVAIARLDDVLTEIGEASERVFLKVDTQGWEMEVLRGAERTLERTVGLLIELVLRPTYEGSPDYLDVLDWLRKRGFGPADFDRVWQDQHGLLAEMDCLFGRVPAPRPC